MSKFKEILHKYRVNLYVYAATTALLILALLGVN